MTRCYRISMVVIGLLVSVPIVVFGSTMVLKLVERFPLIIHAGAAVLAFTAAKMIVSEPLLDEVFDQTVARWAAYAAAVAGVLAAGWWNARRQRGATDDNDNDNDNDGISGPRRNRAGRAA